MSLESHARASNPENKAAEENLEGKPFRVDKVSRYKKKLISVNQLRHA